MKTLPGTRKYQERWQVGVGSWEDGRGICRLHWGANRH